MSYDDLSLVRPAPYKKEPTVMNLRNLTIARRAGLGFALISLLVALLGWFALIQMSTIRQSEVAVESRWMPSMRVVNDIRELMLRIRTISLRMALDPDPAHIGEYRSQMDVRNSDLAKKLETFASFTTTPEERQMADQFKTSLADYQRGIAQSFTLAQQNNPAALTKLLLVDMKTIVDGSGKQLGDMGDFYAKRVDQEGVNAEAQYGHSRNVVLIFVVVAALGTIALALLLTRSIVVPLEEAVTAAEHVAKGDLTQTIRVVGNDEVTRLLKALELM
ncbi:MAG: mcpB 4, partial [Pseudomonas sp.]|nr:mcpB 4 [Pseudomonas sp.]